MTKIKTDLFHSNQ